MIRVHLNKCQSKIEVFNLCKEFIFYGVILDLKASELKRLAEMKPEEIVYEVEQDLHPDNEFRK